MIAAKVVGVQLEPESTVVQFSTIVLAVLKHVLETCHASIVGQRAGVVAFSVVLDLPIDAVQLERALRNKGTFAVAGSDALADVVFISTVGQALVLAHLACVGVSPVAAVGPLLAGGDGGFGDFLAVGVDVVVDFLGDVAGGVVGEEVWAGVSGWVVSW